MVNPSLLGFALKSSLICQVYSIHPASGVCCCSPLCHCPYPIGSFLFILVGFKEGESTLFNRQLCPHWETEEALERAWRGVGVRGAGSGEEFQPTEFCLLISSWVVLFLAALGHGAGLAHTAGPGSLASHRCSDRGRGLFCVCCHGSWLHSEKRRSRNIHLPESEKTEQMEHQMRQIV